MQELWNTETDKLLKDKVECACGRTHFANLPVLINVDITEITRGLVASGVRVLILSSNGITNEFADSVHLGLEKDGYIVSRFSLPEIKDGSVPNIPEGCALIVAMGDDGVLERAKLLSLSFDTKLILIPTSLNFARLASDSSLLDYGGVRIIRPSRAPDCIAVFSKVYADLSDVDFALAFCELFSKILTFCDYKFSAESKSTCCDGIIYSAEQTFNYILDSHIVKNKECMDKLIPSAVRINALLRFSGEEEGGEGQLASTILRFASKKGRRGAEREELLLLSAVLLVKLYDGFLDRDTLYAVVDRNSDVDKVKTLLGIGETSAVDYGLRVGDEDYEYGEYRFNINKDGIKRCVKEGVVLLNKALSVYRRLMPDGGYHLRYFVSAKEMIELVSCSPFYSRGNTLLDFIKERGLLEFENTVT